MAKNRGSFLGTFTNELLFQHHMQCLKLPPPPPPPPPDQFLTSANPILPFVMASRRLVMAKTLINNLLANIKMHQNH